MRNDWVDDRHQPTTTSNWGTKTGAEAKRYSFWAWHIRINFKTFFRLKFLSPKRQSRRAERISALLRTSAVPGSPVPTEDVNVATTSPTRIVNASPTRGITSRHSSISSDEEVYDRLERLKVFDSTDGSPYTRRRLEVQAQQHNPRTASDDIEIVENYYSESNHSSARDSSGSVGSDSSVEDFSVISKNEVSRSRL